MAAMNDSGGIAMSSPVLEEQTQKRNHKDEQDQDEQNQETMNEHDDSHVAHAIPASSGHAQTCLRYKPGTNGRTIARTGRSD